MALSESVNVSPSTGNCTVHRTRPMLEAAHHIRSIPSRIRNIPSRIRSIPSRIRSITDGVLQTRVPTDKNIPSRIRNIASSIRTLTVYNKPGFLLRGSKTITCIGGITFSSTSSPCAAPGDMMRMRQRVELNMILSFQTFTVTLALGFPAAGRNGGTRAAFGLY